MADIRACALVSQYIPKIIMTCTGRLARSAYIVPLPRHLLQNNYDLYGTRVADIRACALVSQYNSAYLKGLYWLTSPLGRMSATRYHTISSTQTVRFHHTISSTQTARFHPHKPPDFTTQTARFHPHKPPDFTTQTVRFHPHKPSDFTTRFHPHNPPDFIHTNRPISPHDFIHTNRPISPHDFTTQTVRFHHTISPDGGTVAHTPIG